MKTENYRIFVCADGYGDNNLEIKDAEFAYMQPAHAAHLKRWLCFQESNMRDEPSESVGWRVQFRFMRLHSNNKLNSLSVFFKTKRERLPVFAALLAFSIGIWCAGCNLKKNDRSSEDPQAEYLARKKAEAPELIVGQPLESTALPENESSNFYAVRLDAGDYIRLTVDGLPKPYKDGSVFMTLLDPEDEVAALSDESPRVQHISATADTTGQYYVRVHRYGSVNSPHRITLVERRRGDEPDRIRAAAYRALTKAYQIREGNLSSEKAGQEALLKYEEALGLARSIGDRRDEAFILSRMGNVCSWLDDRARCYDYYRQALTIYRAEQDREGERDILDYLSIYTTDRQLKIEYQKQLAKIAAEDGDSLTEVYALKRVAEYYADAQTSEDTTRAIDAYGSALTVQKALTAQLAGEPIAKPDSPPVSYSKRAEAEILLKICEMQTRLDQTANALASCRQALELAREVNDKIEEYEAVKMIDEIKKAKTKRSRK